MAGAVSSVAKILGARKAFDASKHSRGAGGKFQFQGGKRKPQPGQHGAAESSSGKTSAKSTVYGLADKMKGAGKKDVIAAATAAGVNPSTAANHYFYWQKAQAEKALSKLGPDPVAAIAKAPDPMQKLKETVGKSIGLKAPAKTPEPKPEPKADPAPKKTEESSGPKLKPEADAALKKLQGLRDKHQAALDKAEPGSDLHKKSANNVKYYNSKIKSHKADPDNHVGVQKPADAPAEVKKAEPEPAPAPKPEPKVDKPPLHPDYQNAHAYHTSNAKYYEGKLAGATKAADKAHYKKYLDVANAELKSIEAKSAAKGAAPPPEPKVQVHPSLQKSYDHYAAQKKHLDSMDTSKMSTYQKTQHNIQKAQVEEQLKGLTKDSDKLMGKPVAKMTDAELAKTVETLKSAAPVKKVDGQHSFDSWKDVNGVHFMGGNAGLSFMKPVRDKAGVTFNNTSVAVKSYTSDGYMNINGGLRGKEKLTAKSKEHVQEIDKLIAESTFKEDTVMWRGVGPEGLVFNGSPPPEELTDKGFTSVSFNPNVARGFSDRKTLFRVRIPKGFPGLNMGIGSPATSDEGLQSEAEVLLPRGTTYRVVARHAEAGPKGLTGKPNMDVVDLEPVLPPGYPKYE